MVEKPDAVSDKIITKLHDLQATEGKSLKAALWTIRQESVPAGNEPHTWREHKTETVVDMLRSIVATGRFQAAMDKYESEGVNFKQHLYVPEIDPVTGERHIDMEDHNHLEKRIGFHVRDGGPPGVDLRRFEEAMKAKVPGLSVAVLQGTRKQSVEDAEKLLSHAVADFFEKKRYTEEARFTRILARWHEATDGRGMSQEERHKANMDMLDLIKDAWMPWHRTTPDWSKVDINV